MQPGDIYKVFSSNQPPQPGGKDRFGLFLGYRDGNAVMIMLKVTGGSYKDRRIEILKPLTGGTGLSKKSWVQCDWYLPVPATTLLGQYYGRLDPSDLHRIIRRFNHFHR